jgi:Tfp pilus assembly protein FimT
MVYLKKNALGLSLLEVTISIALLMLIVTLSMPLFMLHNRLSARAEIESLYSLMLYLQRKAYLERRPQKLVFDSTTNSYRAGDKKVKLSPGIVFGKSTSIPQVPSKLDVHTTTKDKAASTFKNNSVFFYPDGAVTAGTVYLTDSKRSCAYAITCGVAQISFIRKYCYTQRKWRHIT